MITRPMETASAIGPAMAREPQPHGPGVREVADGIRRLFARTSSKRVRTGRRPPSDDVDD